MAVTQLPAVPVAGEPTATFNAKAVAFLGALNTFADQVDAVAVAFNFNATNSTSNTSLSMVTGWQTLTVQAGKSYLAGMFVRIGSTVSTLKWMNGVVSSYNVTTGVLVVYVNDVSAGSPYSGTNWSISQSSPLQTTVIPGLNYLRMLPAWKLDAGCTLINLLSAQSGYALKIPSGNTGHVSCPINGPAVLAKGIRYVVSWLVVSSVAGRAINIDFALSSLPSQSLPSTTTTVSTMSYSFVPTTDDIALNTVMVRFSGGPTAGDLTIYDIKMERGMNATAWTEGRAEVMSQAEGDIRYLDTQFGVGQSWQTFINPSSYFYPPLGGVARLIGVVYTNTTGKAINVSITVRLSASEPAYIGVGPAVVATIDVIGTGTLSVVVPAGANYSFNASAPDTLIMYWNELR